MLFSVVICTYNRAAGLRQTLTALRHQTFPDFEVIVVNGPSTDDTPAVLAEFAGSLKLAHNPEPRLCVSRNLGLSLTSGDVIAFLDDDAIPTPTWLAELATAYTDSRIGAACGIVYDHTGTALQYRHAIAYRDGSTSLDVTLPLDRFLAPGVNPFLQMQGTNMSIRRALLAEIGGFDENIRHYFDDVEISLQVIDHGRRIAALPNAAVHHKYRPSHVRNAHRIVLDPFNAVADRVYFALQHGRAIAPTRELVDRLIADIQLMKRQAAHYVAIGQMTPEQEAHYSRRADEGFEHGLKLGLSSSRKCVSVPPANQREFLRFPTVSPANGRLNLVFITKEYPPGDFGGPGRYSAELAAGFAANGHEVHVITMSPDTYRVDYEEAVWVHRLPEVQRWVPELQTQPLLPNLSHAAAVYREICRIHESSPVDVVTAPLYLCEGAIAACDHRFPTIHTLITAAKAVVSLADPASVSVHDRQLVAWEDDTVMRGQYFHAVSAAILERAEADYGADAKKAFVAALGLRDRRNEHPRTRGHDDRLRVLYVGRVEARKGADVFLTAAEALLSDFPHVEFVLAGKDTLRTDAGDTLRERFTAKHAGNSQILDHVTFAGMVSEEALYQHYADSDIVCLPSLYESFGLVFVEAMIFGKPVIGSRVGGVPEVVADGEQGFLTPPGDASAFTDALRKLLTDAELRTRFGRRSRELYEERFAIPATVSRLETEYRQVIAKHSPEKLQPREPMSAWLATIITFVLKQPPNAALRAAERLLDFSCYPVDYPIEFSRVIGVSDELFVEKFITLLHGERPGQEKIATWVGRLRGVHAGNRLEFVAELASTPEAKRRDVPSGLQTRLEGIVPTTQPVATPIEHPRSLMRKLTGLPKVGKVFEYLRRVILLPWNFHKWYTCERTAHIDETLEKQVLPLLREIATKQRENSESH